MTPHDGSPTPSSAPIASLGRGSRLGPYEIDSLLGAGGMGQVFRARDTRLGRTVALKVLAPDVADRDDLRGRFEIEARAIASLNHPHICALYNIGRDGSVAYMVMEHLEGDSLTERLKKGPLPLAEALRYGIQIADAIDQAHRRGIVHRDLKPGNVMLTRMGAKVLDFGLAQLRESTTGSLDGDHTRSIARPEAASATGDQQSPAFAVSASRVPERRT